MMQCSRVLELVKPCTLHSASPLMPTRTVAAGGVRRAQLGVREARGSCTREGGGRRTWIEWRAQIGACQVDADAAARGGVGHFGFVGAVHALNDGAVRREGRQQQNRERNR